MGRLNATTNAGQIVGLAVSGMLIARFGFRSGFWTMAVIGLLALLFAFFIAQHHAAHSARPKLFATYAALLKHRTIYLACFAPTSRRCRSRWRCPSSPFCWWSRASPPKRPAGCSRSAP